jgi:hypothetical protein
MYPQGLRMYILITFSRILSAFFVGSAAKVLDFVLILGFLSIKIT